MKVYCTRPGCSRPENHCDDLDDETTLKQIPQKFCTACGMPLILDNRYLPERLLGRGGFGAALLARDRRFPNLRQCVVKQFRPPADLTPPQLAMAQKLFEREAQVLDRIGNGHEQIPNLLAYFPLEVEDWLSLQPQQLFYIVQQYIPGQNLEDELGAKGQFTEADIRDLLKQILPVLQFIHDQDVIHRDIKPSNIVRHHETGKLYLLDFGAVKDVTQGLGSTGIYTLGYAPLEQMRGRQIFPCSDLYALAVTCITLLTAREPTELFDDHKNTWKWEQFACLSPELTAIIDRMLELTPNDRFDSAQEVMKVLNPPPPVPKPIPQSRTQPPLQPTPQSKTQPPRPVQSRRSFSTIEVLGGVAFTGFEGTILVMTLGTLIGVPGIGTLCASMTLGGLIFAQVRRWIERLDLVIIAGISLALGFWLVGSQAIVLGILVACGGVAATALFRLVYIILRRIL